LTKIVVAIIEIAVNIISRFSKEGKYTQQITMQEAEAVAAAEHDIALTK